MTNRTDPTLPNKQVWLHTCDCRLHGDNQRAHIRVSTSRVDHCPWCARRCLTAAAPDHLRIFAATGRDRARAWPVLATLAAAASLCTAFWWAVR